MMARTQEIEFAYRGICEHGKVRVLMADDPEDRKRTARTVSKLIRDGLTVDRVTVEEARKSDMACEVCRAKRKAGKS